MQFKTLHTTAENCTKLNHSLSPDVCCDQVRIIQAYENISLSLSCPHKADFDNSFKFMCRGSNRSTCRQQALVTTEKTQHGRFSLRAAHSEFTVELRGVKKEDAGSYLCGIRRDNDFDVFSHINLTVRGKRT